MPRKLRIVKPRIEDIPADVLWLMGDEVLYPKPEETNYWRLHLVPGYLDPHGDPECKRVWDEVKDELLEDWIEKFPGSRPRYWWAHDCPRMTESEIEAHGWKDHCYAPELCEERKRLGGVGDYLHETESYKPEQDCGIFKLDPETIDPSDPPRFESQASFLKRHKLLTPAESRRLKPKDYEPETILPETEEA